MEGYEKQEILQKSKVFFKNVIGKNHIKNTKKLVKLKEFKVNPFLITYLANYLTGNNKPEQQKVVLVAPGANGYIWKNKPSNSIYSF